MLFLGEMGRQRVGGWRDKAGVGVMRRGSSGWCCGSEQGQGISESQKDVDGGMDAVRWGLRCHDVMWGSKVMGSGRQVCVGGTRGDGG